MAPAPNDPFQRLLDVYLAGKWDQVEGMFEGAGQAMKAIPPSEQPKVSYMRQTLAECRPAWWKRCKAAEKFDFAPFVWGHSVRAAFDPAARLGVNSNLVRGQLALTLAWPTAPMDDPANTERGFTKADAACLSVWSALGTAEAWSGIPLEEQSNLKDDAKVLLQQYLDFRGNVTDVYYATPHARRLGLWLCLVMYVGENAGNPVRTAREAVAAMFMDEVVANPGKYPSIHLPKTLPAQGAEESLAGQLRTSIEKDGWTLAEDKFLRDAIAAFAAANGRLVHLKGQVTLPNGLIVALDPAKDQQLRPKRDLWLKSRFDRAAQSR